MKNSRKVALLAVLMLMTCIVTYMAYERTQRGSIPPSEYGGLRSYIATPSNVYAVDITGTNRLTLWSQHDMADALIGAIEKCDCVTQVSQSVSLNDTDDERMVYITLESHNPFSSSSVGSCIHEIEYELNRIYYKTYILMFLGGIVVVLVFHVLLFDLGTEDQHPLVQVPPKRQ